MPTTNERGEKMKILNKIWGILAGILGIITLIFVSTGSMEFEYGWIGYVAAVVLIGYGIWTVISMTRKKQ